MVQMLIFVRYLQPSNWHYFLWFVKIPVVSNRTPTIHSRLNSIFSDGPLSASEEEEDENEFYDAIAESGSASNIGSLNFGSLPDTRVDDEATPRSQSDVPLTETGMGVDEAPDAEKPNESREKEAAPGDLQIMTTAPKKRRTRVPDKPNYPLNLWSIMKNCIGKDLSKIPMPVNFSEPLSMLQRLTEDYEYADILHLAATYVYFFYPLKVLS